MGNSFLQGEFGEGDTDLLVEHYQRSPEQDQQLMLVPSDQDTDTEVQGNSKDTSKDNVQNVRKKLDLL